MSMTIEGFRERIKVLKSRGYSKEKAELIAGLLGDVIEEDKDGKWVVRDEDGNVVDRVDPF